MSPAPTPRPSVGPTPESPPGPAPDPAARPVAVDTSKFYAPALDGMRAIAALLVIALHVGIYTGQVASSWLGIGHGGPLGWLLSRFTVGVPVFFVLSGLLLYRPYANAGRAGHLFPVTVAVTIALAALSYVLIEKPARRLRGRTTADSAAPADPAAPTPRSTTHEHSEPVSSLGGQPPAAGGGAA